MLLSFQRFDWFLVFSDFGQQITIDFLFREVFLHHRLNIRNPGLDFDFFESLLNYWELVHFPFHFRLKHFLQKFMGRPYFQPLFFLWISLAHRFFGDCFDLAFSENRWIIKTFFRYYSLLYRVQVLFTFLILTAQFNN